MDIGARLRFCGCHTAFKESRNINLENLSQEIANRFGVPLMGNKYGSSFSIREKNHIPFVDNATKFKEYERDDEVYLNTYKSTEILGLGIPNWNGEINTTVFYPEE